MIILLAGSHSVAKQWMREHRVSEQETKLILAPRDLEKIMGLDLTNVTVIYGPMYYEIQGITEIEDYILSLKRRYK